MAVNINGTDDVLEKFGRIYISDGDRVAMVSFSPCNNPADAMPIVIRSLISLISDKSDDGESAWWVAQDVTGSIASGLKSNPYRAAMEVFLMMKDAENES
ncbi:DUF2591 domain-containing protein [Morganella morganii]|uniref:phage protein NinX family protein n=1 Tax=Morganella morganii TaxID=582 RepID=UPI0013A78279|nr:phage protein NinX family protein [Morganella morganii]QIC11594.1 DUF2591 domain-containing protein [Morganella morganii]QIC11922.1 DUF2591 domain-containing protein [Morganella morganii]